MPQESPRLPPREGIIPCALLPEVQQQIESYAQALKNLAPSVGDHGLDKAEFWDSGIFHAAIERLRGIQAASMEAKRLFVADILEYMRIHSAIESWEYAGASERHDYSVILPDGRKVAIETKGSLDGNNANIYIRPSDADELVLWSLPQNPGSDPGKNAWSGVHTRLGAEILTGRDRQVDGLIIWGQLCNTQGLPCPKVESDETLITCVGHRHLPPPCVYLFPRTWPEPRNNPSPPCWKLEQVGFLNAVANVFQVDKNSVTDVQIETAMDGAKQIRRTSLLRNGECISQSRWTALKRASR